MNELLIPLGIAAAAVAYWAMCRVRSLAYREKAAALIEMYSSRADASDEDKNFVEGFYLALRFWIMLPIATIVGIPITLARIFFPKEAKVRSKEMDEITDAVMMMYFIRNPITTIICFLVIFAVILIARFLEVLLNRARPLPDASTVYATYATAVSMYPHQRSRSLHS